MRPLGQANLHLDAHCTNLAARLQELRAEAESSRLARAGKVRHAGALLLLRRLGRRQPAEALAKEGSTGVAGTPLPP